MVPKKSCRENLLFIVHATPVLIAKLNKLVSQNNDQINPDRLKSHPSFPIINMPTSAKTSLLLIEKEPINVSANFPLISSS